MIIGINADIDGGITTINQDIGFRYSIKPIPTLKGEYGGKRGHKQKLIEFDTQGIINIFEQYVNCDCHLFIEEQKPAQRQLHSHVFKRAYEYGFVIGLAKAFRFRVHIVGEKVWQNELIGQCDKDDREPLCIKKAIDMLPMVDFTKTERSKLPHYGMVSSCLIAEYGKRIIYEGLK